MRGNTVFASAAAARLPNPAWRRFRTSLFVSNAKPLSSASRRYVPVRKDVAALAAIAGGILIADQVSKALLLGLIGPGSGRSQKSLLGPWLELEYAQNRGASFGLFPDLGPLLTVIAVA